MPTPGAVAEKRGVAPIEFTRGPDPEGVTLYFTQVPKEKRESHGPHMQQLSRSEDFTI